MKLAKKVLSVVLAVAIALGAFVVAASANGNPDTAEYQVKIWLTGTAGTLKWTGKNAVKMTETGDESDPAGVVEAQPGEVVFVKLYVTNNYYVHSFQTNLFYSAGLIDAAEDYNTQRGETITGNNLRKVHLWNKDHEWVAEHGTTNSAQNAWSLQSDSAKYLVSENWPTTDAGEELLDQSEWKWNRIYNLATADIGFTTIWEDDSTHLLMMPVKVPADAAPGSTYTVMIPEGLEQRTAKKGGSLRLAEVGICDGESEVTGDIDTQAQNYPNMQYGDDNQYFDLSEATLTIKVPGEASVDTAALEEKLAEAKDRLNDDLTDTSAALLADAIADGEAALESNDQTVIDNAVTYLEEAIAASEVKADYSALNAAISRYEALDAADWDDASFANATDKYDDAKAIAAGLGVSQQGTIDAAAAALNAAIDALAVALDDSALKAKIAEVEDTDTSIYTDETAGRFNAALAAAKALVATSQDEIDAALAELTAAFAALDEKAADYTAIDKAIADFEALTAKDWTSASYNDAKAAYDAAKAVARDLKITAQATVTAAADALNAKIAALVPATGADYTALDKAIADAEALVADHYVSFAAVNTALATAKGVARDLTSEDQAIIDKAASDLDAAIKALVPADADYSKVTAAKSAAQAILAKTDEGINSYDDATLAAINAALANVVEGLKKADQDKVDAMAAEINAAIANAKFRDYDNSDVLAKIEEFKSYDRDDYVYSTYDAVAAAIDTYVADYTHEFFAQAKLQDIKFNRAWTALALAPAADYAEVEAAKAEFEAAKAAANYTPDSIAAVDAEIAKVDYTLNANFQATVDGYAAAIRAAIAELEEVVVEYADYTAFNKAVNDAWVMDETIYTTASYAAFRGAVNEAANIPMDLTKDQQNIVDEATAAILAAYSILEKLADYSALDAAILRAGTYDKNAWTADSWAAVETALAAAKAIKSGLGESAQAEIDKAAADLNTALDNVVAKPVVSNISTITYKPAEDTHNTFDVVVNGRVAMVQFIEEDGGTRTYDRYNKNVTIKSFNADGEEVNELDRAVAYEIWTINTNLIGPDVEVRTKYISGTRYVWETERYAFTLQFVEPEFDASLRDIQPVALSGKKGAIATTVVVGPDAQGIQFRMANGTTTTYYADKATVLENGDLQFDGKAWANDEGVNTIVIMVRENGKWVEAGAFDYTVE